MPAALVQLHLLGGVQLQVVGGPTGQGRRDRGRAFLAPVYGAFIEGLDTADLGAAAALLGALA